MTNKFLIGARRAGVALALVLLGVSGVLATNINVDLSDIKTVNGAVRQSASTGAAVAGDSRLGVDVFGKWGGSAAAADTVWAKFNWKTRTGGTNSYDSILVLSVGASVNTITIKGALPSTVKVNQIEFTGKGANGVTVVYWDGGTVKGESQANSKEVSEFIVRGTVVDTLKILSGTIETSARSLIKGYRASQDYIGYEKTAAAGGRNLSLISHGADAAIEGDSVVVYTPGTGAYSITSDKVVIKGRVVQVGGNKDDVWDGTLAITGWATASATTVSDAAILTTDVTGQNSKIRVFGRDQKVTITSSGKFVARAPNPLATQTNITFNPATNKVNTPGDTVIYIRGAKLVHKAAAGTGTAGAVVVDAGSATGAGNVWLESTNVEGASATAAVIGQIVNTSGAVWIKGGTYAAASGKIGNAIMAGKNVIIESAKIWASAASLADGALPGYVVSSEFNNVYLLAGDKNPDSAVVAWTGTANVGGVRASGAVYLKSNGSRKAEVRVQNGSGTGIYVFSPLAAVNPDTGVSVKGNSDGSAFVRVALGKAVQVDNQTGAAAKILYFEDAVVSRSGTTLAAGKDYLIDAAGGDVYVTGTKIATASINVASGAPVATSLGVGIFASRSTNTAQVGGHVVVAGGAVHGGVRAIEAYKVYVAYYPNVLLTPSTLGKGSFSKRDVSIQSTSGVTIKSKEEIVVNNPNAKIVNTGGGLNPAVATQGTDNSAVIYSTDSKITIFNVDSVKATSSATALLTTKAPVITDVPGTGLVRTAVYGNVSVYGGVIRSNNGPAIVATGDVVVNKDTSMSVIDPETQKKVTRRDVVISSGIGNASYAYNSAITTEGQNTVGVFFAKVEATAANGGANAIKNTNGGVIVNGTVDNGITMVVSASGSAINVAKGSVTVNGGEVKAEGKGAVATGQYIAAVYVVDGNVTTGQSRGGIPTTIGNANYPPTYTSDAQADITDQSTILTSDGVALAVYAKGSVGDIVSVGNLSRINVKGSNQNYGGIKTVDRVAVQFNGQLSVLNDGSKAFSIDATTGDVSVFPGAKIASKEGVAITTTGGEINISGGVITGDKGTLVYAKKNPEYLRSGIVRVSGTSETEIYNKSGTGIRAEDTVLVAGRTYSRSDDTLTAVYPWIHTDSDTAITVGTAKEAGGIKIEGGRVQASGQHGKYAPVAVVSKRVYLKDGVVLAGEGRASTDDNDRYQGSKATGILIRTGSTGADLGKLQITGGLVQAYGSDTGVVNRDTLVTVEIGWDNEYNVVRADDRNSNNVQTLYAGNNGTVIKSDGPISIRGATLPEDDQKMADGEPATYSVHIKTGNGPNAKGIFMPVLKGVKKKDLVLNNAVVEGGADGAFGVDCDTNTTVKAWHSVVLVRHGSTGIRAQGGVHIVGTYVEVLATNDNRTGTAITGREIRIDGRDESVDENIKSEVHAKDIAVYDGKEGAVVEVTGVIHMSGEVKSHLNIGSSANAATSRKATLSPGSEQSRNLWSLNTASEITELVELGKTLYIPAGVRVSVSDNGSRLEAELSDTIKIEGIVTTVGQQAGAEFVNHGKVIVKDGGNIKFNAMNPLSLKNESDGKIVLTIGSKLNDSLLVHDTGAFMNRKYTFLKWADSLSGDVRGTGKVIIPPLYAILYGNQSVFIDEEDLDEWGNDYWSADGRRVDSVYTAKLVKYPVDRRYKPYVLEVDDEDLPKGDLSVSGLDVIRVDTGNGLATVLFTEAGTFKRVATLENEAGVGTKEYGHTINRVGLKQIQAWQNGVEGQQFFDGYLNNKDGRVLDRDDSLVTVWDFVPDVKYTGSTAKLLDGVKGADYTVYGYEDIDNPNKPIVFKGFQQPQFWYRGVEGTTYPLSSVVPTKVGTYEIKASFAQGLNFEAVPADETSLVYIGRVNVVAGDLTSVFGKADNEYIIHVPLQARIAYPEVKVTLPGLTRFGAKYDTDNLEPTGNSTGSAALNGAAKITSDSILTFKIRDKTSDYGQIIEFNAGILPTTDPENIEQGLAIVVIVEFFTAEEMKETKPVYLTIDYVNEKITGLLSGTRYTINGEAVAAGATEVDVKEEWIGDTIIVKALPGPGSYKSESDEAAIAIGIRPVVTDALRAVTGDSASGSLATDGRLNGTTVAMEYKHADSSQWKPAAAVVTPGLVPGTYNVRLAATKTAFASADVSVVVYARKGDAVVESGRELPNAVVTEVATIKPVTKVTASFTAGPSPVSRNAGKVAFFSAKAVKSGSLYVFDLTGNSVAKVKAKAGVGEIASWNLKDRGGKAVAEGSYVVKGTLTGKDGKKDKVSFVFSVVK